MRKLIVVCLLVISCAKEDFIEENIVVTKPITEIVVPIPEAPIEYTFSTFTVNHPLSAKIWQGLDIAFNGATNFVDGLGVETILLSPSMARWSQAETIDLPTIKLKKAGYWAITDYYEDINMGMGGRSVTPISNNTFLYSDTGPEINDLPYQEWPMNHLWISTTLQTGNTVWTKVSEYKSFYHSGASGDFNNDGLFDIASIHLTPSNNPDESRLHVYLQNPDGSFDQQWIVDEVIDNGAQVLVEDLDGDNLSEIIVTSEVYSGYSDLVNNSVKIFSDPDQDGLYTKLEFIPRTSQWLKESVHIVDAHFSDYDNDGDKDLLTLSTDLNNENYRAFSILRNNGNSTFVDSGITLEWNNSNFHNVSFEVIDFDNDGDDDIIFNAMNINGSSDEVFDEINNRINLDNLVWENINSSYIKSNKGLSIDIPNVSQIKWLKGISIQNNFKFIAIQQINQEQGLLGLLEFYIK